MRWIVHCDCYLGCNTKDSKLDPWQQMFRIQFIIVEDNQVVAEHKCCRVGEDSEEMGHKVLEDSPDRTLRDWKILQEWFHAGHLQVCVGVGVKVVRQSMTDLKQRILMLNSRSNRSMEERERGQRINRLQHLSQT